MTIQEGIELFKRHQGATRRYPRASPWHLGTDNELRSTGFAGRPPLCSGQHSPTGKPVELCKGVRRSTIRSYGKFLECFKERFAEREVVSLTADDIGKFLEECSESLNTSARHLRYAQLKAFFNYIIEATDPNIKNPCNAGVLFKTFKKVYQRQRKILVFPHCGQSRIVG